MSGFSMGVTEVELVMEVAKHSYRAFATVVLPDWGGNEVRISTSESYDSGYESGVANTEERIIKLLEHIMQVGTECLMCGNDCSAERLIALIKGASQKDNETVSLLTEGEK
jgi:hypothetical protein